MKPIHTHYDNLKVARDAPSEVIRAAYKTLSQKYHPDRNGGKPEANRIIQIINTSYDVLSDPARRQQHDEWIARMETENGATATALPPLADIPSASAEARRRHRHRRRFTHRSHREIALDVMDSMDQFLQSLARLSSRFLKRASRSLTWRG